MKHIIPIIPIIPMLLLTATISFSSTPGFDTLVSYDTAWTFVYDGGKDSDGDAIPDNFYDVKALPDGRCICVGQSAGSLYLTQLDLNGTMLWEKKYIVDEKGVGGAL